MTRNKITPRNDEINIALKKTLSALAEIYPGPEFGEWVLEKHPGEMDRYFKNLENSLSYDSDALVFKKIGWYEKTMTDLFREFNLTKGKL